MRKILVLVTTVLILAGCGKEISPSDTRAGLVHGTDGLYRFCDGSTLIYFTDINGRDDIVEAVWPGLCMWNEKEQVWTYDMDSVTAKNPSTTPPTNGNMDDGEHR